jgi:SAM-dependent methyltransferase
MTRATHRGPLVGFSNPEDYAVARGLLREAGYAPEWFRSTLGVEGIESLPREEVHALARRLTGASGLETLVRLFWIGLGASRSAVADALRPMSLDRWLEAGLLLDGDECFAAVKLQPYRDLVVASDPPHHSVVDPPPDWVMGVGKTTLELLRIVVPHAARRVLDVGTGSGIVGLLQAGEGRRVVALDVNPRAVAFATFNARLNGADGFSCRQRSIFDGVGDERFDLVLSNPPFVVAPDARYVYRSVPSSTTLCRDLMRTLAGCLDEGGVCQFVCDWPHASPDSWRDEVAGWTTAIGGCDAWVQRRATLGARDYATTWIRYTESQDEARVAARLQEWLAFYDARDVRWITRGTFTLRRRCGAQSWLRFEDAPVLLDGPGIARRIAEMDAGG